MGATISYKLFEASLESNLEEMKKCMNKGATTNVNISYNDKYATFMQHITIHNRKNIKKFPQVLNLLLENGAGIVGKVSLKEEKDEFKVLELLDVFLRHKIDFDYGDITSYTNEEVELIFSGDVVKPTQKDMDKILTDGQAVLKAAKNLVKNGKFPLSGVATWYDTVTEIPYFLDIFNDIENLSLMFNELIKYNLSKKCHESVWNKITELKLEYKHDYGLFDKVCETSKSINVISFLINTVKYDPNKKHSLMKAVKNNNIISTKQLLENGAFVHYRDIDGKNALEIAATNNNAKIVSVLLQHGAMTNICNNQDLVRHIKSGNIDEVKRCLSLGANINCKIDGKNTLEYAVESKSAEMVAYISGVLSGSIRVEIQSEIGKNETTEEEEGIISKVIPSAPLMNQIPKMK